MTDSHFLWPKRKVLRGLLSAPRFVRVATIEDSLKKMFPAGAPVLCSSGRAALVLALIESEASRGDFVGVFHFASHCVLDAIGRIATPLSGPTAPAAALRIVYHQWGYVQEIDLRANTIEDCVDTLCVPGAALFPGGGRFEIWSLPKILGTTSGGVLWCRDETTAERIRLLRDERGGGLFQWIIRLLAERSPRTYLYWQGAEGDSGRVSRLQTGDIFSAVLRWEAVVSDRRKKLNTVWPLAVEWLQVPSDRLPPVVPIPNALTETTIRALGISSGFRRIERLERNGNRSLQMVLPIPIHQDVTEIWLAGLLNQISNQKNTI